MLDSRLLALTWSIGHQRMYAATDVLAATGSLSYMELLAGVQPTTASSSEAGPAGKCYPGSDGGGLGAFFPKCASMDRKRRRRSSLYYTFLSCIGAVFKWFQVVLLNYAQWLMFFFMTCIIKQFLKMLNFAIWYFLPLNRNNNDYVQILTSVLEASMLLLTVLCSCEFTLQTLSHLKASELHYACVEWLYVRQPSNTYVPPCVKWCLNKCNERSLPWEVS